MKRIDNLFFNHLTIFLVNLDKRFKALLSSCQTVLTLNDVKSRRLVMLREYNENIRKFTFVAPNWIRAFPLTKVADICIIRASTVYAELQPCFVKSSIQIAPPRST